MKIATLLIGLLLLQLNATAESAQTLFERARVLSDLPCYKASFETLMPTNLPSYMRTYGTIYGVATPNGPARSRTETIAEAVAPDGSASSVLRVTTLTIGKRTYQLLADQKRVVEMPPPSNGVVSDILANAAAFSLRMRQEPSTNGTLIYVLSKIFSEEAQRQQAQMANTTRSNNPPTAVALPVVARQDQWLDPETYIVFKEVNFDRAGLMIGGIEYTGIETPPSLPATLFTIPTDYASIAVKTADELGQEFRGAQVVKRSPGRTLLLRLLVLVSAIFPIVVFVLRRHRKQTSRS